MAAAMAACSMGSSLVSRTMALEAGKGLSSQSSSSRMGFAPLPLRRMKSLGVSNGSRVTMTAADVIDKPKKGSQELAKDTLLTPRFYTTDFDEMERMFNTEMNKNLNEAEFEALAAEFKTDYNQTHFVRNPEFKAAAENLQGPLRQIFVEFLERSCTAEFSGFLLYKELGRRLKVGFFFFFFSFG